MHACSFKDIYRVYSFEDTYGLYGDSLAVYDETGLQPGSGTSGGDSSGLVLRDLTTAGRGYYFSNAASLAANASGSATRMIRVLFRADIRPRYERTTRAGFAMRYWVLPAGLPGPEQGGDPVRYTGGALVANNTLCEPLRVVRTAGDRTFHANGTRLLVWDYKLESVRTASYLVMACPHLRVRA